MQCSFNCYKHFQAAPYSPVKFNCVSMKRSNSSVLICHVAIVHFDFISRLSKHIQRFEHSPVFSPMVGPSPNSDVVPGDYNTTPA